VRSIAYSIDEFRILCSSLIKMMNDRYNLISSRGVSNFSEFNDSNKGKVLFRPKNIKPSVIIIDEWADIYFSDKSVESMVCTIAQKGRAAGVFIVMATQRPSSKVVSGLVKASFPARIALRTSTSVDSRVVLEQSGAEKMTDPGTGLYRDAYSFAPTIFRSPIITPYCIEEVLRGLRV
jgi:S-DNA-T family DNA segregation ATPase FtsK/SpoIIIE